MGIGSKIANFSKTVLSVALIVLFFGVFNSLAFSQVQSSMFDNFSVSNGLDDKTIHCIFQDSEGWIWIGTDFGLMRFDGYSFKKFTVGSDLSEVLENSLIRTIYEDKNGIIWIGTENQGIFKYDRRYYAVEQFSGDLLSNSSVWAIEEDINHNLWLGTENGLNYFNPSTKKVEFIMQIENSPGILSGNFIRELLIDSKNRIWLGTENGVTVLNSDRTVYKKFLTDIVVSDKRENEVWIIFQDESNNIWLGTYLGGLWQYSASDSEFKEIILDSKNNRSNTVRSIVQDKKGNMWFGTRGGLYSIDKTSKSVNFYRENNLDNFSLVHNSVLCLFADKKGDLWIGTRNGISFLNFDRQAFGYLSANAGNYLKLNNSEVYAFWEDRQQNIWVGTESGGINIYNKKANTIKYLISETGLSSNCIKAISPDSKGNLLIGTFLDGLNQYNPATGKNIIYQHNTNDENSISDNSIFAIYTDSKGKIWVGTTAGVDIFNDNLGTFTHYGEKFEVGWVVMIFEDPAGRMWMYSEDLKRLTMINQAGNIRHFPYKTRSMVSDNEGYLWIGTTGEGLVRYDPLKNKVKYFTTSNGLCSNVIYGMLLTENRYIWLSTNNGLSRFDIKTNEFKNFYINNGLLNNQFNYGATLKLSDGTLVFGGKKGVDFIFVSKLEENNYIPPVVLTEFRLFNKVVPVNSSKDKKVILQNLICETDKVVLPYDQNMITFDFAALNFANSSNNRYKYKLEGFDREWNDIGTSHSATYTNLYHGNYIFKVIGTNSDNKYNPEGLSFNLVVLPPYWKTWWFRLIMSLVLMILFYFIYIIIINREKLKHQLYFERQTARQIQELDRLKHQFFMNISHEIRTPLSLIVGPLDKLINSEMSREIMASHLNIIKRNTTILGKLINQLLDYRKLETGNLHLELKQGNISVFIKEIVDAFKPMAQEKNIELDYNSFQRNIFTLFDADKIEKIINNLLSNALKYTNSGGKVSVSVSLTFIDELDNTGSYMPPVDSDKEVEKQYIRIVVRDTGIGIPTSQTSRIFDRFRQLDNKYRNTSPGTGIGLSLTKELVKLHQGHIKLKSAEGKGSKFTILFPYEIANASSEIEHEVLIPNATNNLPVNHTSQPEAVNIDDKHYPNQPILLVVDDNADIREFIKHHFVPEYIVIEAKDGKEGWDMALDTIPDIVVADVMMPLIDGNELCRKIKNDERTSHIPVIMLTALASKEKQLAGIDAGADDYITKPFDVTVLKAKTDNMLYIRKSLRERYSKEMLLKPKDIVLTSPDEKFLKRVIQVIEKNISLPELDVDLLAKHVGVSRTQLYRKINALTDMAAKEFVKDIRLKRAAQLIVQDKLNVSEVALEVGFNDISYFRKCFKEKFGMNASDYMKNHHE